MIQKKIIGRIGNQMFQYAAIRNYMIKYNICDEIGFNFDLVGNGENGYEDSLKLLKVLPYKTIGKIKYNFSQFIIIFIVKLFEKVITIFSNNRKLESNLYKFEKKIQKFINKFGVFWVTNGYIELDECKFNKNNLIFNGFFESEKYFKENKDIILEEFKPKEVMPFEIEQLSAKLKNYTCISIRRGDFISNSKFRQIHYICDEQYFDRAIKKLKEIEDNTKYFICSDDIEWCKENMKFEGEVIYETGRNTLMEKIFLMSSCKNFIISNSTFSWWTQYLSKHKEKIVIAPSIWRKNDYTDGKVTNDIYQEGWIKI